MNHVQTKILSRVMTLLTGLPTTGSRVFEGRVHPLTPTAMPGLCVSMGAEQPIGATLSETTKGVDLVMSAFAEGDDVVVTASVLAEIEAALYGDYAAGRFFSGLAISVIYRGADRQYVTSSALPHTKMDIVYRIEYQTVDGDAETAC